MHLFLADKFMEIYNKAELIQYQNEDCVLIVDDIGELITKILDNTTLFQDNIVAINQTFSKVDVQYKNNKYYLA